MEKSKINQIKSKNRVRKHGEVFTAEREVKAMCDLVKDETERIDSRFLEPACGDGNFLAEILTRKLAVVRKKYGKSPLDYEKNSSLSYTGIDKHNSDEIGGWDTTIRKEEYEKLFYNQQATMTAPDIQDTIPQNFTLPFDDSEIAASDDMEDEEVVSTSAVSDTANSITATDTATTDKAEEDIDLSAVTVGTKVIHAKFGEGTVVKIDKRSAYIHVAFSVGEKTFGLNNAFKMGFLRLA